MSGVKARGERRLGVGGDGETEWKEFELWGKVDAIRISVQDYPFYTTFSVALLLQWLVFFVFGCLQPPVFLKSRIIFVSLEKYVSLHSTVGMVLDGYLYGWGQKGVDGTFSAITKTNNRKFDDDYHIFEVSLHKYLHRSPKIRFGCVDEFGRNLVPCQG